MKAQYDKNIQYYKNLLKQHNIKEINIEQFKKEERLDTVEEDPFNLDTLQDEYIDLKFETEQLQIIDNPSDEEDKIDLDIIDMDHETRLNKP